MGFRPGQRVVCIDDVSHGQYMPPGWTSVRHVLNGLTKGRIYTIREVDELSGVLVCRLEEIVRPWDEDWEFESPFAQARFRPVKEVDTDISFAHEILNTARRSMENV